MTSIYSRIIAGEIPGRFVWRDDRAVAIVDIRPLSKGHTLVIPVAEVDHWTDLEPTLAAHLMTVAHAVANAQKHAWNPARVGLMIAGFEVPHVHLHVMPAPSMAAFDFAQADPHASPESLDAVMHELRQALRSLGHGAHVPS
jgi:histidine triad (HIT) family protein